MTPLEIVFELGSPVILPGAPGEHLDGLMAYVKVHCRENPLTSFQEVRAVAEDLPLARYVAQDGRWVWKASTILYDQANNVSTMGRVRRSEPDVMAEMRIGEDFDRRAKESAYKEAVRQFKKGNGPMPEDLPDEFVPKLVMRGQYHNGASGRQRNYLMFNQTVVSPRARAYCVGELEEVRQLVERITALGKKRIIGSGIVNGVSVKEVDEAQCLWYVRNMPEPVPSKANDFELYGKGGLSSPYWDKTTHSPVFRHKAYP